MHVLLTSLYGDKYPANGETHGLSVIAGHMAAAAGDANVSFDVIDMVPLVKFSLQPHLAAIKVRCPDIIGISVSYGTMSVLPRAVRALRRAAPSAQFVYGGALATYNSRHILEAIDPYGIVFIGEGESSFTQYVIANPTRELLHEIPNLAFKPNPMLEAIHFTQRAAVAVEKMVAPYRSHLRPYINSGIQLFTEASRGCSWAHCTFCLRGLLDIKGHPSEYRRMSSDRLLSDLHQLKALGAKSFTFADEDFFGGAIEGVEQTLATLRTFRNESGSAIMFHASLTVHSLYSSKMTENQIAYRAKLLTGFKLAGLKKVFLGIESGSPSQLKRYAKGHTVEEIKIAIQMIRENGIALELGLIMFDPLCSVEEVYQNLSFLVDTNTVQDTSYLFNELRLQKSTSYERLLDTYELRTGIKLKTSNYNFDTVSYAYNYADSKVETLVETVHYWASYVQDFHYTIKSICRSELSNDYKDDTSKLMALLETYRVELCQTLTCVADGLKQNQPVDKNTILPLQIKTQQKIQDWITQLTSEQREHALIQKLYTQALKND